MTKDVGSRDERGIVVVLVPRRPSRTGAVDSQLMAAAHLASGFEKLVGSDRVRLVTEEGPSSPAAVLDAAVREGAAGSRGRLSRLPRGARLAAGDLQALIRRRRLSRLDVPGPVRLVVQYHHRFQDVGLRIARRHGCPWVLRVEALEIAEQQDWGMRRPLLGPLVARVGEHRLLRRADVVSPVSEALAESLVLAGVRRDRLLPVPNGVDLDVFMPADTVPISKLRDCGLEDRFLVGWAGGFRPYHGLGQVEAIVALLEQRVPDATLCLLGTGPMRSELVQVAGRHPTSLRLLPPVRQSELPAWLATFEVCLQLAVPDGGQHYSPLKVLEYLACGRPVVASDVRTSALLTHGVDAMLYPAGDTVRLVELLSGLRSSPDLRETLGRNARLAAERRGSWSTVAQRMLDATADSVRGM